MHDLRDKLVDLALSWEQAFGNAPHITAALSEFDAAQLVGCSIDQYCKCMRGGTSVRRGHDFQFNGRRYQVKANRPSGKPAASSPWFPKSETTIGMSWSGFYTIRVIKLKKHGSGKLSPIGRRLSPSNDFRLSIIGKVSAYSN